MGEGFPNNLNGHLEKGVKPIMVCVGTPEEFDIDFLKDFYKKINDTPPSALNVNYFEPPENIEKQKFLTNIDQAYVMSTIDSLDKGSVGFMNCTGLIVCGIDKNSGENVSFLTHQNPIQLFVYNGEADFVKDLEKQLNEMKDRCKPETIDAIVVGGLLDSGYQSDEGIYKNDYLESLRLLSREVIKVLGFDPVVVNGPKIYSSDDWDSVYFLNKERNAYLVRPEVNQTRDFGAGEGSKIFNVGKKY